MDCPRCNNDLVEAICENPSTKETAELMVCESCGYRGRRMEVYSRVVGYLRPVDSWNLGKKEEFKNRETFKI